MEAGLVDERNAKAMDLCYATSSKYTSLVSAMTEFATVYADVTNSVLFKELSPEEGAQELIDEYMDIIEDLKK